MTTNKLTQYMRKSAGYTIDQTILIVAVIAVLITLIIASVGWDLLNRTSGTKFASYLKQIEEANGAFYSRQGVWPHIAVDDAGVAPAGSEQENYIGVLAAVDSVGGAAANQYGARWKPYLSGFDVTIVAADSNVLVEHDFGSGGAITQTVGVCSGADNDGMVHYEIVFAEMPLTEIVNADEAIDGAVDFQNGRFTYDDANTQIQTARYCANLLN